MARLWSSGFELNSTTNGVEWETVSNSPSISSSTVRTGSYAMEITGLSSGTLMGMNHDFVVSAAAGPYFFRFYFRYATAPSADNTIFKAISGPGMPINIKLTSSGELKLYNGGTQIGSTSSALTSNTWYRIEAKYDASQAAGSDILEAKIDGTTFASSSSLTLSNINKVSIGGNQNDSPESQTQGNWFFDDFAVNDDSGSFQNSYPGSGKIIHLKPNASGDNNEFDTEVGGTAGASNNYTRVDEVTPDDATSYNADAGDATDDYNVENSGIGGSDTVNLVAVGVRGQYAAAFDVSIWGRLKASSGGTTDEGAVTVNDAWVTNGKSDPHAYAVTSYQKPGTSNDWTQTDLDAMQIGARVAAAAGATRVTTVWALVEYVEAGTTTSTSSTSSSTSTSSTSTSTTTTQSTSTSSTSTSTSLTTSTSTSTSSTSTSTTVSFTTSTSSTSTSTTQSTSTSTSTSSTSTSTTVSTSTSTSSTSTSTTQSTSTSTSTSSTSTSTSMSTSTSSTSSSTSTSQSTSTSSTSTSTTVSTSTSSTSSSTSTSQSTSTSTSTSSTSSSTSSTTTLPMSPMDIPTVRIRRDIRP